MSERLPILAHVLPLRGRQLIEASAGTGKTWTLAALYVRLVIGHGRGGLSQGLLPPQILVMTFTEAATAELRDRIRERLRQAAVAFALPLNSPPADDFLAALVQDTPESERAACAEQLSRAVSWMDESAIHTIHGWSMRALREHAFQSRSLFELQHLPDAQQVWLELARDHVRQFVYPLSASALAALAAEKLTPDPDAWVLALKEKRQDFQRYPSRPIDPATLPSPQQALQAMSDWLDQEQAILNEIKNHFDPQLAQDILAYKKTTQGVLGHLKSNHIDALMARVMAWVKGHELTVKTEDLSKLGYQQMVEKKWPAEKTHQALKDIDRWLELQAHKPTSIREAVLDHALHSMLHAYRQLKEKAGLFDFQDLLEHLYWAVTDERNNLAQVLREQHPVALVDEFQDTDPWQYGTLNRIYAPHTEGTLVMIGDPDRKSTRLNSSHT